MAPNSLGALIGTLLLIELPGDVLSLWLALIVFLYIGLRLVHPAWQVTALVLRRDRIAARAGGTAACAAAMLLLAFPFLLWVRSTTAEDPEDRYWALSGKSTVKLSQVAASSPLGPTGSSDQFSTSRPEGPATSGSWDTFAWIVGDGIWANRHGKMVRSLWKMTAYILAPFFILGLAGLRGVNLWKGAFYFSFPLGYLAGLTLALRTVPHSSIRYVVPVMSLLFPLAGAGLLVLLRWLKSRWPHPRWDPAWRGLVAALVLMLALPSFRLQRQEQAAVREAAAWIREHSIENARIFSTTDKIGYLTRGKLLNYPPTWRGFEEVMDTLPADFCVYYERDIDREIPGYLRKIPDSGRFGPAVTFPRTPRKGGR